MGVPKTTEEHPGRTPKTSPRDECLRRAPETSARDESLRDERLRDRRPQDGRPREAGRTPVRDGRPHGKGAHSNEMESLLFFCMHVLNC